MCKGKEKGGWERELSSKDWLSISVLDFHQYKTCPSLHPNKEVIFNRWGKCVIVCMCVCVCVCERERESI